MFSLESYVLYLRIWCSSYAQDFQGENWRRTRSSHGLGSRVQYCEYLFTKPPITEECGTPASAQLCSSHDALCSGTRYAAGATLQLVWNYKKMFKILCLSFRRFWTLFVPQKVLDLVGSSDGPRSCLFLKRFWNLSALQKVQDLIGSLDGPGPCLFFITFWTLFVPQNILDFVCSSERSGLCLFLRRF